MARHWRLFILGLLFATPVLFLVGYGAYSVYENGLSWVYWFIVPIMGLAWLLAWYWQRKQQLGLKLDFAPPLHWTERDQNAWKLVEARAKAGEKLPPANFTDFQFYSTTAQEMAL